MKNKNIFPVALLQKIIARKFPLLLERGTKLVRTLGRTKEVASILFLFFLFSCNSAPKDPGSNSPLAAVKTEMDMKAVEEITGKPTSVNDLGVATSETGDTTHLVQWFYGNNQNVMFTNGKVSSVDLDMKASQEKLQHIMDSARAIEGGGNAPMIQPQQN